jgi:hypothetical protein
MPQLWVPADQQGTGFYQYYGQDTVAATRSTANVPFDFSSDPDGPNKGRNNIPPASNFFFYNKVGNVGMIGYSGANNFQENSEYFKEACAWADSANIDVVLLLGHWNSDGDGCDSDASVPAAYQELSQLAECANVTPKVKYFMGHKHCNVVVEPDVGFMVGAQGMSDASDCGGAFGIPVVDTTGGTFKVYYFPIAQAGEFDNYDATLSCVQANGVSGCYHLATLWSSTPL